MPITIVRNIDGPVYPVNTIQVKPKPAKTNQVGEPLKIPSRLWFAAGAGIATLVVLSPAAFYYGRSRVAPISSLKKFDIFGIATYTGLTYGAGLYAFDYVNLRWVYHNHLTNTFFLAGAVAALPMCLTRKKPWTTSVGYMMIFGVLSVMGKRSAINRAKRK